MVSWLAHRQRRPTLDDARGTFERERGEPEPPTAQPRPPNPRWPPAREPCQTLAPLARQRGYLGGGVFLTVCRERMGSVSS